MPCPVPVGGVLPWQASPAEAALPARAHAAASAAQIGTNLLYIGGSDGTAATATTYVAEGRQGQLRRLGEGPGAARGPHRRRARDPERHRVPHRRASGRMGAPTNTVWSLGLDPDDNALTTVDRPVVAEGEEPLTVPEPRAGAAAVAVSDGIVVVGGRGRRQAPTDTVWKSTLDAKGALGAFEEQPASAASRRRCRHRVRGRLPVGLRRHGRHAAPRATSSARDYGATPARRERRAERRPRQLRRLASPKVVISGRPTRRRTCPGRARAPPASPRTARCTSSAAPTARRATGRAVLGAPGLRGNLPGGWHHLDT